MGREEAEALLVGTPWHLDDAGFVFRREIEDRGLCLAVEPLLYRQARLHLYRPPAEGSIDVWDYLSIEAAVSAATTFDGTGEPTGWHRHLGSGRYRNGGDPEAEYTLDDPTPRRARRRTPRRRRR